MNARAKLMEKQGSGRKMPCSTGDSGSFPSKLEKLRPRGWPAQVEVNAVLDLVAAS